MYLGISSVKKIDSKRNPLQIFLIGMLIYFCLTPWVSYGLNNLDSQPFPAVMAAMYILINLKTIRLGYSSLYVFFLIAFGVLFALYFSLRDTFVIVRGLYNFISFFLIYIVFENIFKKYDVKGIVKALNLVWLLFCLVELFFPEFVSQLKQTRTTDGRGLTSLAAEPTFFAVYLILSSFLIYHMDQMRFRSSIILHMLNLFGIFILARSSMGIDHFRVLIRR